MNYVIMSTLILILIIVASTSSKGLLFQKLLIICTGVCFLFSFILNCLQLLYYLNFSINIQFLQLYVCSLIYATKMYLLCTYCRYFLCKYIKHIKCVIEMLMLSRKSYYLVFFFFFFFVVLVKSLCFSLLLM